MKPEKITTPEQLATLLDVYDAAVDAHRQPYWGGLFGDLVDYLHEVIQLAAGEHGYVSIEEALSLHRVKMAGPTTTPHELRSLLDVWMTADPADRYPGIQHRPFAAFVGREAVAHGYEDIVAAYHDHRPEPTTRVLVDRPLDGTMETAP